MSNKITVKLLEQVIEGALLASGKTLSVSDVRGYFDEGDVIPSNAEIRKIFDKLVKRYKARGIELKQVATGYRFQVAEVAAPYVVKQWHEKPQKYSRALLETLVLIAYRQPITRGDIEDIRGVSVSSNIIRTLIEREWIRIVGHKDVPGRPSLFATTSKFLDYFNLKSLTELPELSEVKNLEEINPELDFGETLGLPGVALEQDPQADFDGESADMIPDTEAPITDSVAEISAEDQERIRQEKEAKNKEKELQQELEAREELQSIDRYNNAFEQIIRKPELQTSNLVDPDEHASEETESNKSRFAQLADKLEEVIEHSESQQQEQAELMADLASQENDSNSDPDKPQVDHISMMDAIANHQSKPLGEAVRSFEEPDTESSLSKLNDAVESHSEPSSTNDEMTEAEIQAFIQQKLAEQQALLDGNKPVQNKPLPQDSGLEPNQDDELLQAIADESTYYEESREDEIASSNTWSELDDLETEPEVTNIQRDSEDQSEHKEEPASKSSDGGIKNSWDL